MVPLCGTGPQKHICVHMYIYIYICICIYICIYWTSQFGELYFRRGPHGVKLKAHSDHDREFIKAVRVRIQAIVVIAVIIVKIFVVTILVIVVIFLLTVVMMVRVIIVKLACRARPTTGFFFSQEMLPCIKAWEAFDVRGWGCVIVWGRGVDMVLVEHEDQKRTPQSRWLVIFPEP